MSALTFRNRVGDLIDIQAVTASDAKNRFGAILDQATSTGPVAITRHDKSRAVLISVEEFESLVAGRESSLAALGGQFDSLLAAMQSPKARKGIEAAFASTPAELGSTAVKAARRRK